MEEKFFTTEQVANILQVHPFTILKFIKAGKLKGVKLGRVYRIKEGDMKEFIEDRMTGEKKEPKIKEEVFAPRLNNQNTHPGTDHYYII